MFSNKNFLKKDNELHDIHFLLRFLGLKRINAPGENSNTSEFKRKILLIFTETYDIYLGAYTDMIIGDRENAESYFKCKII